MHVVCINLVILAYGSNCFAHTSITTCLCMQISKNNLILLLRKNVIPSLLLVMLFLWKSTDVFKYIEDITRWREDMNFVFEWH